MNSTQLHTPEQYHVVLYCVCERVCTHVLDSESTVHPALALESTVHPAGYSLGIGWQNLISSTQRALHASNANFELFVSFWSVGMSSVKHLQVRLAWTLLLY
jgi:hypothetical protein